MELPLRGDRRGNWPLRHRRQTLARPLETVVHVRVVSLIVCVHRHLLEVRHGGWIAVGVRLGQVVMGIIYGRRWQTVSQHRVRW